MSKIMIAVFFIVFLTASPASAGSDFGPEQSTPPETRIVIENDSGNDWVVALLGAVGLMGAAYISVKVGKKKSKE